jgi:hypothetical protein
MNTNMDVDIHIHICPDVCQNFCLEIDKISFQSVLCFITGGTCTLELIPLKSRQKNFLYIVKYKESERRNRRGQFKTKEFSRKIKFAVFCNEKTFSLAGLYKVSVETNYSLFQVQEQT